MYKNPYSNKTCTVIEYELKSTKYNEVDMTMNLNKGVFNNGTTVALIEQGYAGAESKSRVQTLSMTVTSQPSGAPVTPVVVGLSDAEVAGIIIGVILFLALAALLGYYAYVHLCLRASITGV